MPDSDLLGDYDDPKPAKAKRPWVANGPEERLSIALDRFLRRALVPPFYCTAIHDRDGGERSMVQRSRDKNRGVQKGQLDWHVVQDGRWCPVELKRGRNTTSEAQDLTISTLNACGIRPIVAWSLREAARGLQEEGFKFLPNAAQTLLHWEEQLAGWDREAEAIKTGLVVKKRTKRKPGPRFVMSAGTVARARKQGIRL